MKELKKLKLKDLNNGEAMNVSHLSKILGGSVLRDGCKNGVCENNRDYGSSKFCGTDSATCSSGVSTCTENT